MVIPSCSSTSCRQCLDVAWTLPYLQLHRISSRASTSCSDLALDGYLQSHHISSSTGTSCFDLALDFFAKLEKCEFYCKVFVKYLKKQVRLLKTIFLYVKKCRRRGNQKALLEHDQKDKGNITSESLRCKVICFSIQDVVVRMFLDLYFAYLLYKNTDSTNFGIIRSALIRSETNIKMFLETDIKKSCTIIFFDYYSPKDPQLVMDLIESLSDTLEQLLWGWRLKDTVRHQLKLLKNLIGLATMQDFECTQLANLLTHTAVVVGRLISVCWFGKHDAQELDQINLLDLQVRETCIHVLTASKKQPRSLYALALEENANLVVVQFISSLHDYLNDLLESYASIKARVKDQILKLYRGMKYLSILLKQEQKLRDETKDLIGVVVCDAGIVIFSLSINEIEECFLEEIDLGLFHLHKVLKYLEVEVAHNCRLTSPYLSFNYPRSNELVCMDFFLENLKELGSSDEANDSIVFLLDRIQMVQEDLKFLRSFLENIKDQRYHDGKLQAFWSHVMEAAYKAELSIDSTLVGDKCEDSLNAVARDINLLKIEALEIQNGQIQRVNKTFTVIPSQLIATIHHEDLVGLDDKVKSIINRLRSGSKQLNFVPIVGMPGLGKTTLANKVYIADSVRSHFHVRGWCCVSQMYSMQSLLVQLLCSISSESPDEYLKKDENDLAKELKQVLLRNRYLLVLDDLWDVQAWNLLEKSLPNDANGSKILFTSRFQNLSSQFKPDSNPYHLRPLADEESWTLLQKKVFDKEGCPPTLSEVGFQIAKTCRGLPLTVVLVAGILSTTAQDRWEEVAKCLSFIVLDNKDCKKTLELSYSHLPDYLKPCLLYFAAFQEDEVINVRRLLWLWISEGLVQQTKGKSLEESAYDYLMALISRSLVLVTKQRTMGGAKTCQLHDLVHEYCVEKAKEEGFLCVIHSWKDPFGLAGPSNHHRVHAHNTGELKIWEIMLIFPNLRSLLLSGPNGDDYLTEKEELGILLPKLLRVLDLGRYNYVSMEVVSLVHLRYLVLHGIRSIPSAIDNLSRLETLIVKDPCHQIELPNTIWNLKRLSYLHTTSWPGFLFPAKNLEVSPNLDHLDTLNLSIDPSSQSLQKILAKLPSIRRLKCIGPNPDSIITFGARSCEKILEFDNMRQLESLHLIKLPGYGFKFPSNLKKLAFIFNFQPWSEISRIGKLPNLEVLKLWTQTFVGEEWVMKEGEFPKLRVLELSMLGIRIWTASSDNFCHLEKLVVHNCWKLEEVPSCLGECLTLEMIQVEECHESVANSVKQIQKEQLDSGNEVLKIIIEKCYDTNCSEEESNCLEAEEISSERESISSHHT
ncbi:putative late blight resistance protein homolog R1A-3 [Coffea eugenioides]|uniref:putative late blight resistance protein homolog R1A-3 n=1 Tax=Coffea eugenioides TaxID=49369 RepID=UPI000F609893|nr:putative late blight resistance protein homolog R1A-3 [Coffea eugenioides]